MRFQARFKMQKNVALQKAVKNGAPSKLEVLSDAKVAVENITRYAGTQGYQVAVDTVGEDFKLTLTR